MLTGHNFTGMAQRLARGAHNSEVTRSKRVAGIFQFTSFTEAGRHSSRDVKHEHPFTGMAQRQRARLITARSQDQNLLPVFSNSSALEKLTRCRISNPTYSPVWRRGSALLKTRLLHLDHLWSDLRMVMAYTPEDVGSKPTTGIFQFAGLQESATLSLQHLFHRRGAEVARAAHNRKDTRSKRVVGIYHSQFYRNWSSRC